MTARTNTTDAPTARLTTTPAGAADTPHVRTDARTDAASTDPTGAVDTKHSRTDAAVTDPTGSDRDTGPAGPRPEGEATP